MPLASNAYASGPSTVRSSPLILRLASPALLVLLFTAAAAADPPADPARRLFAPDRTWAFLVGILEWQDAASFAPFPQEDRRDTQLAGFFRAAGVPAERVVVLQDGDATLERIRARLAETLAHTRKGDFLFLYYAGHGGRDETTGAVSFANYDAGETMWPVDELARAVGTSFRGDRVFLSADCCHSGGLAQAARAHIARAQVVCLTSSLSRVISTGNWTFTDSLLAGLRGDPATDLDANGTITLDELGEFAGDRMAWVEEQLVTYRLLGGAHGDLVVAPARAGARPVPARRVEVRWEGDWWRAEVLREEDGRSLVRYNGYDADQDEWVGPDRIRPHRPLVVPAGAKVRVEWQGTWYAARVLESERGLHRVRYDGYGEEWDEWVGPRRLRDKKKRK